MKKYTLLVLLSSLLLTSCGNETKQTIKNVVPNHDEDLTIALDYETASYYFSKALLNLHSATSFTQVDETVVTKEWADLYNLGYISYSPLPLECECVERVEMSLGAFENGLYDSYKIFDDYVDNSGVKHHTEYEEFYSTIIDNVTGDSEGGTYDFKEYNYYSTEEYERGTYESTKVPYVNQNELDNAYQLINDMARSRIFYFLQSIETEFMFAYDMGDYIHYVSSYFDYYTSLNPTYESGDPDGKKEVTFCYEEYYSYDVYEKDGDYFFKSISYGDKDYILEDFEGNLLKEEVTLDSYSRVINITSYGDNPRYESEIYDKCEKQTQGIYLVVLTPNGDNLDIIETNNNFVNITKTYNLVYPNNQYDVYVASFSNLTDKYIGFASYDNLVAAEAGEDLVLEDYVYEDKVYGEYYLEGQHHESEGNIPSYTLIHGLDNEPFSLFLFVDKASNDLVKVQVTSFNENFPHGYPVY